MPKLTSHTQKPVHVFLLWTNHRDTYLAASNASAYTGAFCFSLANFALDNIPLFAQSVHIENKLSTL